MNIEMGVAALIGAGLGLLYSKLFIRPKCTDLTKTCLCGHTVNLHSHYNGGYIGMCYKFNCECCCYTAQLEN